MSTNATKVSVQIGTPAQEFRDIEEYSIDSNVLTLCDTFMVKVSDPYGSRKLDFERGDAIKVYMSDPSVSGGQNVLQVTGIIVETERVADDGGGVTVAITGADLGWHLVNNCGDLFKTLSGLEWTKFLQAILNPSWNFAGVRIGNEDNANALKGLKLNQARAAVAAARSAEGTFVPPVCFEAGEMIADKLITYARRAKYLVNVSGDGWLQLFQPNYSRSGEPAYTLHFHKLSESSRNKNNVKSPVRIRETIDTLYTDVVMVWTVPVPSAYPDKFNPHRGTGRAIVTDSSVLPFTHYLTCSDGDAMHQALANDRVQQKFQRGQFDAWTGEYKVEGHVLGGTFITPDTVCGLDDTVNGESGNRYVAARRFVRNQREGTVTMLQLKKPNLLRA